MSRVTCHPKKVVKMLAIAMTCEIVRDIKMLNNTTQYCLILHSIAQYCPIFFHIVQYCQILSSNVQYCPVLLYIIRLAILASFCSSFYDVMSDSIKHCSILSSISLHSRVWTNIVQKAKAKLSFGQKAVISSLSKLTIESKNFVCKSCSVWYAIWECQIKSES